MARLALLPSMILMMAVGTAKAMPGDDEIADEIAAYLNGSSPVGPCTDPECIKPKKKYERIMNTQPGYQWGDAGGYCGSFATQRAAMSKGAWISQQQVRDATVPGGGHDNEILDTNIEQAWQTLKLKYEAFDYRHEATPHIDKVRTFIKKQLVAGHVVVEMIQKAGHTFPIYDLPPPSGFYDHIVPWTGILSDHPLDDGTFYDDDYVVHYTDHSVYPYYRSMKSLVGAYRLQSSCPSTSGDPQYICLNPTYGYSWAIQGFADAREAQPASLTVDPSESEPDTRRGQPPIPLAGTLHIEGLTSGARYAVYRWDAVETAFDYTKPSAVHYFNATSATETYADPESIASNGTTYYRCVSA